MAPVRGKWLACKPCTEVPWSVDGPFGDLRRDAKPPGQLSVGEEPQRPGEQSGEARRQVVFDVPGRPLGSDRSNRRAARDREPSGHSRGRCRKSVRCIRPVKRSRAAGGRVEGPEKTPVRLRRRHPHTGRRSEAPIAAGSFPTAQPLLEVEKQAVADALRHAKGNKTRAAAALGLSRGAFYRRLERFGLVA